MTAQIAAYGRLVADSVVSARTARPGSGPANQENASNQGRKPEAQRPAPYPQPEDFDQTPLYDAPC